MMQVTALYVRADSVYKTLPGVDAWDEERDARKWPNNGPCVAHPPCRGWGRMRQWSYADEEERKLGIKAVLSVQWCGGVVEHPAESSLWVHMGLPRPGQAPRRGGYTIEVDQFHWGHRAEKRTWLYIVGCEPDDLPPIPKREGSPTHCVRPTKTYPRLPSITKPERERTPPAFAQWLGRSRPEMWVGTHRGGRVSEAERYGFSVRGDPGDMPLGWCAKHHCPKRVEDDCSQCGGDGQILIDDDPGMSNHYVRCWVCHGNGMSEPECEYCLEEDAQ